MEIQFSNTFVTSLLILLCLLASYDLYQQYASKYSDMIFYQYSMGMQTIDDLWVIGYRLENMNIKLQYLQQQYSKLSTKFNHELSNSYSSQMLNTLRGNNNEGNNNNKNAHDSGGFMKRKFIRNFLANLDESIDDIPKIPFEKQQNQTGIVELWCEDINQLIRIGSNDFRTDERDSCLLYSGDITVAIQGPETMFQLVDLGDESFGLKSITNDKFVQVIPPGSGDSFDPWKISLGGYIPGAPERFRLSPEGYLFSGLMGGFLSCSANNALSGSSYSGMKSKFIFQYVDAEIAREMKERVEISNQIIEIQSGHLEKHKIQQQQQQQQQQQEEEKEKEAAKSATEVTDKNQKDDKEVMIKICLGVPMTSKKTQMKDISESPVWVNLFDSFLDSIDWSSNHYHYGFYLGFDKADELYDTGDAWSDMREMFKKRAEYRLKDQLIEQSLVDTILKEQLAIKLAHFSHLEGAPSQIVSQLMLKAYEEGYDYFYQVNDDTQIITPNWADTFITALKSNPIASNVGVTGPLDKNNDKIFTHSFVHRTHIEIFGTLFPSSFKNWWSDDWISTVYGAVHTFRHDQIQIQHNVGAQKIGGYTRYTVDQSAKLRLDKELMLGYVQIDKWLLKHAYPRLTMPMVCGYIPLVRHLTSSFEISKKDEKEEL